MSKKKNNREYAIVDIETTGGYASGSKITEVAIIVFDGEKITDRFETLVNPERDIPLPIFALTGINNEMVAHAPKFEMIAEKVFGMLENRVFVAHNVNFDYSFIKQQLSAEGYPFSAPKLCTVRMSRKIKPGLYSYSLGNLCQSLEIPIQNRHRAGGDAEATAILFSKLMEWDEEGIIPEMLKRNSKEQQLPPNLQKSDFENLPNCPGVYYFRNKAGKVVYVGKAINIKKRVSSHFTGHNPNPQRQNFLKDIYHISYEICGTELMAFLLECVEIKKLYPIYNRALKRFEPKFGLFQYKDISGYQRLAVGKLSKNQTSIRVFHQLFEGINVLLNLIEQHDLDIRLCYLGQETDRFQPNEIPYPPAEAYNLKVEKALEELDSKQPSFAILGKGRNEEEKSCIWVENGRFYAMGYLDKAIDFSDFEAVKESLERFPDNYYMNQLIHSFAEKNPQSVYVIDDEFKLETIQKSF
ncbi:exonuclease domain-containing protein [Moheibacter lacus]|uniref:GIY-YIG nuclease family protein n=1 Tax=Moheibacter lacus TaxID=2745851 RepID=A0A838ZNN5_9FLAO|nr:exonuclease domain-containing protein [Moheibacter lacus]MBA5629590.1 GIY-YIG nuclease family protein [Moheibacter lacus]